MCYLCTRYLHGYGLASGVGNLRRHLFGNLAVGKLLELH